MEELTPSENLFQIWMIYCSKNDINKFKEFIQLFITNYKHLIDIDFLHLNDGFSDEGPHITVLPDNILHVLGNHLSSCSINLQTGDDPEDLEFATSLLRCLIVISRNYDNIPLVASCEFAKNIVALASICMEKLSTGNCGNKEQLDMFFRLTVHFFECLYDPYFVWRKRLKSWTVDKSRMTFKPASLHVEVVPFFYDFCQKEHLSTDLRLRLLHMFGAIMCGTQYNALKVITPATLDVLLKMLSSSQLRGPTNEQRQEMLELKDLVLKCIICMVHVIHVSSPDQRQVEVSQVMEGYMQVLLENNMEPEDERENQMQLAMIGAINEMLACQDKNALQVILVTGGTFDAFVSLLQKTSLTGSEAQKLAMSVLRVMSSVLSGSVNAKERFSLRVGYGKFVEALKSLGQPSMSLLGAVLNLVVEGEFDPSQPQVIQNTQAAIMLLLWLPDIQSHDLQIWLSENMFILCSRGHNKINCCNDGMISAILTVLGREKQIDQKAVGYLINLLESLGTQSVMATEMKHLIGLLKLDDEEKQNPYCSRLMRAISTMARRDGKDGALHFFSLFDVNDCISVPGIRKWPGSAFSFHAWLCLDMDIDVSQHNVTDPQLYRRQLYSFVSSSGNGFEAFFTPSLALVIAVYNKKEYSTVAVTETKLNDSHWHCIDIVHTSSRRPFTHSQLNVYIDGKLQLNSQLKFPNMAEPFGPARIGCPCSKTVITTAASEQNHTQASDTKRLSSFRSLFQRSSQQSPDPDVTSIPTGTQSDVWGPAITLNAQLGSVSVFHEALYPAQIKSMFTAGPNHQTLFYDDEFSDLSDLSNKMVLYYNAKACRNGHCVDLSTNQNHGQLIGQRCVTRDIKDVINCIGGIQVLFPLLEQVNKGPLPLLNTQQPVQDLGDIRKGMEQDDWVVIPSSSYSDTKLEQNQVAGFLTMLRYMIHSQVTNQETFIRTNGAATIGALLQKVNPKFIDVNVLMSVQLLVETTAAVNQTLLQHLYQYVLFDFRIWSRSDFPVRIGHIQYLSTIIKDDRKYFKRRFGVQYILDVIRTYYSSSSESELTMEDMKTIRVSLLSLVKYYMMKDVTGDEVNSIMKLLVVTCDENMTCEILDVLMALLETRNKQDQLHLLMFEPDTAEMLYGLLVQPGKSVIYYEKIVKVLYILLKTDKVYEKSKARLRLTDAGLLGLVGLMQSCEISGPMIKRFLEQASTLDTPQSYNSLLALLQLIYYSGSDIKLETSRQILSILVTRPGAAKQFAKQLGWQESFIKLFIYQMTDTQPVNSSADDLDPSCDTVTTSLQGETTAVCDQNTEQQNGLCNTDNSHPSPRRTSIGHPKVLNLSTVAICDTTCKQTSPSSRTPVTPMYMSRAFGEISSSEEERSRSLSRSSSASVEDLTAMAQRAQDRHASISLSNSSFTLSDSAIDLNTSQDYTDSSKRPSSATTQADNIQKALDNLGIQKIYVKDSVERSEELCQNLLIILLTIMWKGVEGSDQAAWKERGQVFSWLDKVCENHKLIRSEVEVKRRLLEMMVHSCTTGIRDTAQGTVAPTENAMELIKLVHCFMCQDSDEDPEKYSERLIEDVMTMLDYLSVWSVETDGGWKEMAHLGLNLLLKYSNQPNLELCAVATAKLHTLVQTKLISSSAEASYLIGNLNTIILQAVKDNADSYSFLIPVMKALVDKAHHLLQLEMLLPSLPSTSRSPTFFDDFKNYCMSEEWTTYVQNFITPQQLHFSESTFEELETKTVTFWEECKEAMMVNMHKRNRERGESKLKFENQVMNSFNTKASSEQRRFQNISTQLRNQHYSTLRQWRATRRFLTGERGAWADKYISTVHWKLSNQENFSRMKVKMIPNMNFDPHADASLARDNLGASEADIAEQIEQLKLAKVAVVSKENIHDDSLGDEDWSVISTERSSEPQGKEKLVLSEDCELVTSIDVVKGRLEVTTTHVYFFDCSNHIKEEGGEDFKLSLSQLREIHFRRYNLRRSALEVFLVDQTNYFLNFQHKMRNRVYTRILSLRPPNLIYYGSRSPAELLRSSGLTKKWLNREISNFDYLMQLNTIAGRTYNDLSQYPVFPWILCDYISDHLDLENPEVYRDLSKPIGVVNPKCEREVREKFDHFEDPSGVIEKFHYGTHYSNAAGVMHFMLRMEPFTTLHIQLQSNRFDVADRQFHSIPATWSCLMENPNDVKELIPEFFYLPEFLVNMNDFDLGKLQLTKERINHVVLPKWAKSPEDFIYKHRKALESDHVSSHLHEWIDLIFGYKQKGPAAVEALNVFYYCTYEGAVDLDAVTDEKERKALEGMINNFGQTPCQLLKEPHPMRMTMEEVVARAMKLDKPLSVFQFLDQLKVFFVEVSAETDPLVYVSVPRNQARSIIQHGMPDTMLTLSEEGIIGTHGWLPYDKSISNYFTFDKDPALSNAKVKKKLLCPFAPGLKVDAKLFVVSHDGKLLFSGGHWDNSLQVYNIGKGRKVNHAVGHNDIVTCLALDYCGSHLMTGSGDTTCIVWQVIHQGGTSSNIDNKPLQILYGHDAEVTDVHLSVELDTAVSASKDGTVIIHTVRRGHYMRTLRPPCLMGYTLNIPYLVMDEVGHIVLYCHETFPVEPKERFSLHLYSINGHHLYTEKLTCGLGHMIVSGDYLITGDNQGQLCVREIFGLTASTVLPLHVGVHSLAVTNGNSHILAGLKDGKLIIIGVKNRSEIR